MKRRIRKRRKSTWIRGLIRVTLILYRKLFVTFWHLVYAAGIFACDAHMPHTIYMRGANNDTSRTRTYEFETQLSSFSSWVQPHPGDVAVSIHLLYDPWKRLWMRAHTQTNTHIHMSQMHFVHPRTITPIHNYVNVNFSFLQSPLTVLCIKANCFTPIRTWAIKNNWITATTKLVQKLTSIYELFFFFKNSTCFKDVEKKEKRLKNNDNEANVIKQFCWQFCYGTALVNVDYWLNFRGQTECRSAMMISSAHWRYSCCGNFCVKQSSRSRKSTQDTFCRVGALLNYIHSASVLLTGYSVTLILGTHYGARTILIFASFAYYFSNLTLITRILSVHFIVTILLFLLNHFFFFCFCKIIFNCN